MTTGWEAPVRICLAGENLDWLGGRSACVAVALPTRVVRSAARLRGGAESIQDLTWSYVSTMVDASSRQPPPVSIEQSAPDASGLATSSALAMCLLQVQLELTSAQPLPRADVIRIAYQLERRTTKGGGMDQLSVGYGGALLFMGRDPGLPDVVDHSPWPESWRLVVVDSGLVKHSPTRIADVRRRLAAGDPTLLRYITLADRHAEDIWGAIRGRRLSDVHRILDEGHATMRDHQGSSTKRLELLRSVLLDAGCDAVKLTGAGGGGALFTVAPKDYAGRLAQDLRIALQGHGLQSRVMIAAADHEGLRPSPRIRSAASNCLATAAPRRPGPPA